jgi:hypothetical protein
MKIRIQTDYVEYGEYKLTLIADGATDVVWYGNRGEILMRRNKLCAQYAHVAERVEANGMPEANDLREN